MMQRVGDAAGRWCGEKMICQKTDVTGDQVCRRQVEIATMEYGRKMVVAQSERSITFSA
jgi:hypothetical protein